MPFATWNVAQALSDSQRTIASDASTQARAVAYCWLFHLVGEIYEPMHSKALFCERFPTGDRGGNSIPLGQGKNLHTLWDSLLGRDDRLNDVRRAVFALGQRPKDAWEGDVHSDPTAWIAESHELAKSFAYDPVILAAVREPGPLKPIRMPTEHLKTAGAHARDRVIAAGMRLSVMLGGTTTKSEKQRTADATAAAEDGFIQPMASTPWGSASAARQ